MILDTIAQYQRTQQWIARFTHALTAQQATTREGIAAGTDPRILHAVCASMASQIADLQEQCCVYEATYGLSTTP